MDGHVTSFAESADTGSECAPLPPSQTVSPILDATTANTVFFAITAHADEREAHVREVEQFDQSLLESSYARRNRRAKATARCG